MNFLQEMKYPANGPKWVRTFIDLLKVLPWAKLYRNKSYSQRGEDLILKAIVKNKHGSYIDIGSGLPCWGNNTYFLYKKGWRGVLVDPVSRNIFWSRIFRSGDKSLKIGIGAENNNKTFYEFSPSEFSTMDLDVKNQLKRRGIASLVSEYLVEITTLKDVVDRHFVRVYPTVLSIDVEGNDLNVLLGNDWLTFTPEVVCIEELTSPIYKPTQVRTFLEKHGYRLHAYNGMTSFYVHSSFD